MSDRPVPPPDGRAVQPSSDAWISRDDHDFRMAVSNSLTEIKGRLDTIEDRMETTKTDRRWLIGTVIAGMIASAGVLSLILLLVQTFDSGATP